MKIDCCRCDKEIKKPETNCYCNKCVEDMSEWRLLNYLQDYFLDLHRKYKVKVLKKQKLM